MTVRALPPVEFLRECFSCDPAEGIVRWKYRPERHFKYAATARAWNLRYAGEVGCPDGEYATFSVKYGGEVTRLFAHVIAYALYSGRTDFDEIDHRNVDPSDNRESNLREATRAQNNANRRSSNKTGLPKGVSLARSGRYVATGSIDRKTRCLGTFDTAAEAHEVYCRFTRPLHGEFFNPGPEKVSVFD